MGYRCGGVVVVGLEMVGRVYKKYVVDLECGIRRYLKKVIGDIAKKRVEDAQERRLFTIYPTIPTLAKHATSTCKQPIAIDAKHSIVPPPSINAIAVPGVDAEGT